MSLRGKSIVVVLLLALMASFFFAFYSYLVWGAERESLKQQNAKEIIARATELVRSLYNAGDNVGKYSINHEADYLQKYNTAKAFIKQELSWLKEHLQGNSKQLKLLAKIDSNISTNLGLLDQMKTVSDEEAPLVAMKFAMKQRASVQSNMESLLIDLIEFLNSEKLIERESPKVLQAQRRETKVLLVAAFLLNIFAALALTLLFIRGVTTPLKVVEDNSQRLRRRKPLHAPLLGNDEIALIDQAFHQMSHSLKGEEALVQASEEQLQSIIDQMPIGLVIVESEIIEYANPAMINLLATKASALIGTAMAARFTSDEVQASPLRSNKDVAAVKNLLAIRDDKSRVAVECTIGDVSLGKVSKQLVTVIDVTEKRAMEKLKESFVAMVSHDLRTPLTSVSGFLEMLPMGIYGAISDAVKAEAKIADSQTEKLISLINDLLNLEKLRAGQLPVKIAQCQLEDLLDAAVDAVYRIAEQQDVAIVFEGCQLVIDTDQDLLQQVMVKSLETLLQICSPKSAIEIVTDNAIANGEKNLTVNFNTVNPLNSAVPASLFEPFALIDTIQAGKISLGLYLPLAEEIIKSLGGSCGAKIENKTFSLWLKLPASKNLN